MELEMSIKTNAEGFEPVHIEEGVYPAELKEVKDISEGQYGARVAFIYDVEGNELALVAYKTKATKDNKIGKTLIAHGVDIIDGKTETDNLPTKKVQAWVEDFEKEITRNGKTEKVLTSTISKVKPIVEKVN